MVGFGPGVFFCGKNRRGRRKNARSGVGEGIGKLICNGAPNGRLRKKKGGFH